MIHGDSVYDIIDKQDHASIQSELMRGLQPENTSASILDNGNEKRIFLCRMNVSRNARRQMRFGDQKVTIYVHTGPSEGLKIRGCQSPFVEIGLADMPNLWGAMAPSVAPGTTALTHTTGLLVQGWGQWGRGIFLCSKSVSSNTKKPVWFANQKVMLVQYWFIGIGGLGVGGKSQSLLGERAYTKY